MFRIVNHFGSEVDQVDGHTELDSILKYATKIDLPPSSVLRLGYRAERIEADENNSTKGGE